MTPIDDQIRAALSEGDRELLDEFGDEPGLFELVGATFRGKMRTIVVFTWVITFALFAFSIWCLIEAISASTAMAAVQWGIGFGWASLGVGLLKMWNWMQMNHQATLRELKRIELQLALQHRAESSADVTR